MSPEYFMKRAIDLALLGRGRTAPNPMVGCVIEYKGKIIGEGWHKKYGSAHAEVNAFNSVIDESVLSEANVYVTLEPCSHFGKTPPCSDLIVSKNVNKVFIGSVDCNPIVAGSGINKISSSGIQVVTGILEQECQNINVRYNTFHLESRPFVVLKWAQSADFYIDPRKSKNSEGQVSVSSPESKVLTHKFRNEEDAILVGTTAANIDNPSLTNRKWAGKSPLRIVIDKTLKLSSGLELFDDTHPTLVLTTKSKAKTKNTTYLKLDFNNLVIELLDYLSSINIQSLIVEGGAKTLQSFIDNELWDEARIYTSEKKFKGGTLSPNIKWTSRQEYSLGDNKLSVLSS
jgi:diaminohydroxyphosphoribosylaminopyrimidine deaminase/5-amino-6-(5-phosphoribosylamino)uracil reductase